MTDTFKSFALENTLIEFVVNGQSCRVDLFDALDELVHVDQRHETMYQVRCDNDGVLPEGPEFLALQEAWLVDLRDTLQALLGLECLGKRQALEIYQRLCETGAEIKKKRTPTLESPTGTESTPTTGPPGGSKDF